MSNLQISKEKLYTYRKGGLVIEETNDIVFADCNNIKFSFSTRDQHAKRISNCLNYCEGASNEELEHSSYEKAKAKLMDAFSLIGQYRAQRDAMVKASLGLIRSIGSKHTKELRAAVETVKRHDHSTDPMITALLQIVQDSEETPHIQAIAKAALEKGGAL